MSKHDEAERKLVYNETTFYTECGFTKYLLEYVNDMRTMEKKLNDLERFFYLDFSPADKLSKEEKLEHSQLMNKIIDTVFKKVGDEK
jgi:hypothetical protein